MLSSMPFRRIVFAPSLQLPIDGIVNDGRTIEEKDLKHIKKSVSEQFAPTNRNYLDAEFESHLDSMMELGIADLFRRADNQLRRLVRFVALGRYIGILEEIMRLGLEGPKSGVDVKEVNRKWQKVEESIRVLE